MAIEPLGLSAHEQGGGDSLLKSLEPTEIVQADVAIVHPQLRDLIAPISGRKVAFVSADSIGVASFASGGVSCAAPNEPSTKESDNHLNPLLLRQQQQQVTSKTDILAELHFTPNVITSHGSHIAVCGAQAELTIFDLSRSRPGPSRSLVPIVQSHLAYPASISNAIALATSLRSLSGYGGTMRALIANNDGTVRVLGFERHSPGSRLLRPVDIAKWEAGTPVNHTGLSPDGSVLAVVGDTNEVHLVSMLNGGERPTKLATYKASTDASFSTSWSHDGRRLAVASQDGCISIWDHRSSKKLASLSTTARSPHRLASLYAYSPTAVSSSTPLSPARVVRFSPAGAPRELLMYTEDLSRVHVVDARALGAEDEAREHLVLNIPHDGGSTAAPASTSTSTSASSSSSSAIEITPNRTAPPPALSLPLVLVTRREGEPTEEDRREARLASLPFRSGPLGLSSSSPNFPLSSSSTSATGAGYLHQPRSHAHHHLSPPTTNSAISHARQRLIGTSGCGFSECGRWIYAGTEAAIAEWEVSPPVGGGGNGWRVGGEGSLA